MMSTNNRNSEKKEEISNMEAWSDNLLVVAFFIFLVLLGFIVR